jgi:hypothetical protein
MAGAAADVESATMRLGLPATSSGLREHKGEHVYKKELGYASRARPVPSGSGTRRGVATWRPRAAERVSAVRLGWPLPARDRALARERACGFKNAPALAPLGEKIPRRAALRLAAAECRRARLGLGNRKVNRGAFTPRRMCACAQVHDVFTRA